MAGLSFFLAAVLVSLQVVQDGVHSCTLRSHKTSSGLPSACSTPDAASPTSPAISHRTPAPCATPKLGLQYPDAFNKIPSISPVSFSQPNPVPAVAPPPFITPVSSTSGNNRILIDLMLEYFAATKPPHRLPLPPPSLRDSITPSPPAKLTPALYPTTPNLQNGTVDLEQFLSLLLSVSGPGSEIINPAVPSDRLLPSLPENTGTPPLIAVQNALPSAPASVNVPKSTSPVPEMAPVVSTSSPIYFLATDPNTVPANVVAAQTPDPAVLLSEFVNTSVSTLAAPTSGSASEAAVVSNTVQAADSVPSASSSAVGSLAPLPPADITTPTTV